MSKKMKRYQPTKEQLLVKFANQKVKQKYEENLTNGMLADQLIDIWIKWQSYGWDKESLQEYWEIKKKWMAMYVYGKMSDEDIGTMARKIKDELEIDIFSPKVLTEEMCNDAVEVYDEQRDVREDDADH